jgi:hypothetical protein
VQFNGFREESRLQVALLLILPNFFIFSRCKPIMGHIYMPYQKVIFGVMNNLVDDVYRQYRVYVTSNQGYVSSLLL